MSLVTNSIFNNNVNQNFPIYHKYRKFNMI